MIIEHNGIHPKIHETAYVAPTATICGDVTIGQHCRVMFGAIINAEEGRIEIGDNCTLMESTIIKGDVEYLTKLGDHISVEPRAYLSGCLIEDGATVKTGATVLSSSRIGKEAEIGINSIVYGHTNVLPNAVVPFGCVAMGNDPTFMLAPSEKGRIYYLTRRLHTLRSLP